MFRLPNYLQSKLYKSGIILKISHCWCDFYQNTNPFYICAKAIDSKGYQSDWAKFEVDITNLGNTYLPFTFIRQLSKILLDRISKIT